MDCIFVCLYVCITVWLATRYKDEGGRDKCIELQADLLDRCLTSHTSLSVSASFWSSMLVLPACLPCLPACLPHQGSPCGLHLPPRATAHRAAIRERAAGPEPEHPEDQSRLQIDVRGRRIYPHQVPNWRHIKKSSETGFVLIHHHIQV